MPEMKITGDNISLSSVVNAEELADTIRKLFGDREFVITIEPKEKVDDNPN